MKKIAFILSLLFLFPIPNVYATTLIHKSFEKVIQESEEILEGKVVLQESRYGKGKKTIYTYITLAQVESIKGENTQKTKTLRFEGGCVRNDCLTVAGMPTFQIGEKVILFKKRGITDQTICPLVGWPQGKFSVEVDATTRQEVIHDGFGNRITGLDTQKGELTRESISQSERPVPIPISGSPDQLVSPSLPSQKVQSESISLSKDTFKEKIKEIMQKQVSAASAKESVKPNRESPSEQEAVSPPEVAQ